MGIQIPLIDLPMPKAFVHVGKFYSGRTVYLEKSANHQHFSDIVPPKKELA
jgi:hypothetical protein